MRRWPWVVAVVALAGLAGLVVHEPPPAHEARPVGIGPPFPGDAARPGPLPGAAAPNLEPGASSTPAPAGSGGDVHDPVLRLVDAEGRPIVGALVYRSDARLEAATNTWQAHWADRNATGVATDDAGMVRLPDGAGPVHVRAAGFTPASSPAPDESVTWRLAPRPEVVAIAHRAGAAYAPENTLAAVHTAALMGAPWVELDVRITADRRLVVIHDEDLKRTTNGTGRVALATWGQIMDLDAGSWFDPSYADEPLPTLVAALHAVKLHGIGVVIELKTDRPAQGPGDAPTDAVVFQKALDDIHRANLTLDQTIISSFGQTSSHTCARITASTCGWIVRRNETGMVSAGAMVSGLQIVHLHRLDADEQAVAQVKSACDLLDGSTQRCPRVFAYTVNKREDMAQLAAYVDGMTTDRIDLLMATLASA